MCKNGDCECECCYEDQTQACMLRLNEPAPNFEAQTTQGVLRLSDYKDSWLIFFSHPADFTPVCTTELLAFTEIYPELEKRGVEVLALSVESIYAHIAWVRSIEEKMGIKIPFPLIADLDKNIATQYGMIMPGENKSETARCVFIIDPQGILRLTMYYPKSIGRNINEIIRILDALQTSDKFQVATPANWVAGEKVIIPPATTLEAAEMHLSEGHECVDWYLCKKNLD